MTFTLPATLNKKMAISRCAVMTREVAREAMSCLDLTSLKGNETDNDIFELCDVAKANRVASVCIYPDKVPVAKKSIKDGSVIVATVINFPHGDKRTLSNEIATAETTAEDVSKAVAAGAKQIDIVLSHDDFRQGKIREVTSLLQACRMSCPEGVTMKVIIETASFDDTTSLISACRLSIKQGADCLKTSTGKHKKGGATLEAAAILMNEAYRSNRKVGCKISGGVSIENCAQYMILARAIMKKWDVIQPALFRIGASSLLNDLLDVMRYGAPEITDRKAPLTKKLNYN